MARPRSLAPDDTRPAFLIDTWRALHRGLGAARATIELLELCHDPEVRAHGRRLRAQLERSWDRSRRRPPQAWNRLDLQEGLKVYGFLRRLALRDAAVDAAGNGIVRQQRDRLATELLQAHAPLDQYISHVRRRDAAVRLGHDG